MRGIAVAIDVRDGATSSHSDEVAAFAGAIGERLGLLGPELASLQRAAQLHDAGKIGVPDAVLLKPGPLTAEERTVMERHSALGYRIMLAAGLPEREALWVLHHHEHVDGSGYPHGLRGDEIPLASRILLVADAFQAMTAPRPYRAARSPEAALAELRRCAGIQFDRAAVDALTAVVGHDAFGRAGRGRRLRTGACPKGWRDEVAQLVARPAAAARDDRVRRRRLQLDPGQRRAATDAQARARGRRELDGPQRRRPRLGAQGARRRPRRPRPDPRPRRRRSRSRSRSRSRPPTPKPKATATPTPVATAAPTPAPTAVPTPTGPLDPVTVTGTHGKVVAGSITFRMSASSHAPKVGEDWALNASAMRSGSPISGRVRVDALFQGAPVQDIDSGRLKAGRYDYHNAWPQQAVGYPLTIRVRISAGGLEQVFLFDINVQG